MKIKIARAVAGIIVFLLVILAGCENSKPVYVGWSSTLTGHPKGYGPAKIHITPLTEFVHVIGDDSGVRLKVVVDILDSYGSGMKGPGVFRFELYEYVPRSTDPRGKRLFLWPDVDLTDPTVNNAHWRDFLRAYEFNMLLDLQLQKGQNYVLQVRCVCPGGKRMLDKLTMKYE